MNWNAECEPDPIAWPHWYSCVNGSISPHSCSNIYCKAFPWSLLGGCLHTIGHVQSCCICDFMLLCAVFRNQKVILHLTEVSKCHCIPTNIIVVSSLPMPCVCVLPELSVHVQGQMGTFMSVWVWITLPATSGSPHGTADYGRRERRAGGRCHPLFKDAYMTAVFSSRALAQMPNEKVTCPRYSHRTIAKHSAIYIELT